MREPQKISTFGQAVALHRQGRLEDAERLCLAISRSFPEHFDALHLLGVIAFQTRRLERAVELLGQAIALNPYDARAYYNRGLALMDLGRPKEALPHYDRAIGLKPDYVAAHNNQGNMLLVLGHAEEAVRSFDTAITSQPDHAESYNNRGGVLMTLGRSDAALADFGQAITLRPGYAAAHANRGSALRAIGRLADALPDHDRAIALNPNDIETLYSRGHTLRDLGRFEEALRDYDGTIALRPNLAASHRDRGVVLAELGRPGEALLSYDKALSLRPDDAAAHNNRGNVLHDLGRPEEALASYDRAAALNPSLAEAHNNRGNVLRDLERLTEALSAYDAAIALNPDYAPAHNNRGVTLSDLGRPEEALTSYGDALALRPDFVEARFNQGVCHLALGDFRRGWEGFEWYRKSRRDVVDRDFAGPPWLGVSPVEGKTILVHAEYGFGDSLQFCRFVPMLAERAAIVLDVPRPLLRLLSGLRAVSRIIARDEPVPPVDAWVPMMSLPLAFGTTLETIPATVPYLHADPEQSAIWRQRLAAIPGLKVGLVWAGSPRPEFPGNFFVDRRRSIALRDYAPLAAIPGLCLVSLQKGEAGAQARTPPDGMVLHDWTAELNDFADTAALIDALDLVISVDTSVVHLAGALGKPVWVLNRFDQCWRWLRDRTDSPWYPSARLFRQDTPGDWTGVIRDVVEALSGRLERFRFTP